MQRWLVTYQWKDEIDRARQEMRIVEGSPLLWIARKRDIDLRSNQGRKDYVLLFTQPIQSEEEYEALKAIL